MMKKWLGGGVLFIGILFSTLAYTSGYFGSLEGGGGGGGGSGEWGAITGTLSDQSDLQSALDAKVATSGNETIAGTKTFSTAPICSSLTASTVPYLDGSKQMASSSVTPTELGYLSGVTSAIQTQFTAKANLASPDFTGAVTMPDGSVSAPGLDFGENTGLFSTAQGNVQVAINGENAAAFIDGGSYKYLRLHAETSPSTKYIDWYYWNDQDAMYVDLLSGSVASNFVKYTSNATTNFGFQMILPSSETFELKAYNATAPDYPGTWGVFHGSNTTGQYQILTWGRRGETCFGPDKLGCAAVTIQTHPDHTIEGTTTANATTTITGSSTQFEDDISPGDQIALSSSSSTFATVLTQTSDTALTVDTALGAGTTQNIIRRRAITSWRQQNGNTVAVVSPQGYLGLSVINPTVTLDVNGQVDLSPDSTVVNGTQAAVSVLPTPTMTGNSSTANQAINLNNQVDTTGFTHSGSSMGIYAKVQNSGTGTMTNAMCIQTQPRMATAGTITNAYGLYVQNATNSGGGTLTNQYGIYIDDLSRATGSNYAIYHAGSQSSVFANTLTLSANTVTGGTSSGGNLVLRSTTNASKGQVYVDETTASTSSSTGALRVGGGAGVSGSVYTGAQVVAGTRQLSGVVTLTDGATPALDASLGNTFDLTAAGDRTIAVPTNPVNGQRILIRHRASGGSRTLSLNTGAGGFRFGTDVTGLTATTSGATDYIGAVYDSTDGFWDVIAYVKGY